MDIKKYGDMLFISMDIGTDKILVVSNFKESELIAESFIGSALGRNVESIETDDSTSDIDLLKTRVTKELKRNGWYFENPEKYYKRCALCGRKYTYAEAIKKDRVCCGSGNYIISEWKWKAAESRTLKNVRIFKITKGPI